MEDERRPRQNYVLHGKRTVEVRLSIGRENGSVLCYDIFPNSAEGRRLKAHLRRQKQRLGETPKVVIADAGYGREEHYRYWERQ
jgi:hypothetical protein